MKIELQFFGGRGSSGSRSSGGMSKTEEDRLVAELNKTDKYRYHATTEDSFSSIKENGLQPSRGMYGEGVYFAESPKDAIGWAESSTSGKVVMRVDNRTLVKAGYAEFKGDQGWTDTGISSKAIQVRTSEGKWIPVNDAVVSYNRGKASITKRPRSKK